jgi:hypothetical protein
MLKCSKYLYRAKWKVNMPKCSKYQAKLTGSSFKLLQIQGKWYQERNQKHRPKPYQKKPQTILHPLEYIRQCSVYFFVNFCVESWGTWNCWAVGIKSSVGPANDAALARLPCSFILVSLHSGLVDWLKICFLVTNIGFMLFILIIFFHWFLIVCIVVPDCSGF